jgi:predicted membrane protein
MMSLNEWKELAMISFTVLTTMLIVAYIIAGIIARIKNKAQKRARKQITHKTAKIDLYDYLTAKMKQEYIGQRKIIFNELIRM